MAEKKRAPYRVCFVCTGNICRSPMAETVFRSHLADAGLAELVDVESAGTSSWEVGDDADPRARAALAAAGYPTSRHRARQFAPAWFDRLDLVVALDAGHLDDLVALAPDAESVGGIRLLRSFDPAAGVGDLDVPDPYYGSPAGFVRTLELIEAAMPGLLAHVITRVAARVRGGG